MSGGVRCHVCGESVATERRPLHLECHRDLVEAAVKQAIEKARQEAYNAGYEDGRTAALFGVGEIE